MSADNNSQKVTPSEEWDGLPEPKVGDRLWVQHWPGSDLIEVFDPAEGDCPQQPIALPKSPECETLEQVEKYLLDNRLRMIGTWTPYDEDMLYADLEWMGFEDD